MRTGHGLIWVKVKNSLLYLQDCQLVVGQQDNQQLTNRSPTGCNSWLEKKNKTK